MGDQRRNLLLSSLFGLRLSTVVRKLVVLADFVEVADGQEGPWEFEDLGGSALCEAVKMILGTHITGPLCGNPAGFSPGRVFFSF